MPIPLIWLGAGVAAVYSGLKYTEQQHFLNAGPSVLPVDGALVSCGIFGLFEHSGIWLDGNIIELKGNGLIRAISPARFLAKRSGERIVIACDAQSQPLIAKNAAARAVAQLYQYREYDLLKNNCHRFVWNCISGKNEPLTRFRDLNQRLEQFFECRIVWANAKVA